MWELLMLDVVLGTYLLGIIGNIADTQYSFIYFSLLNLFPNCMNPTC